MENLNKHIEEARNSYYESVQQVTELRKAYEAAQTERDKRRVKMDVAIYKYNISTGREYTIKLGSGIFDVIDVKPNGTSYEIIYRTKNGSMKTINKTMMPQLKPQPVPDNEQYEF